MGFYDSITKATQRGGAATKYDQHSIAAPDVLNGMTDGLSPSGDPGWTVASPEQIKVPTTATQEDADREELEAIDYANGVANGIRLVRARGKKVREQVKLVLEHRNYQKGLVKAGVAIAGANKGLADVMQNARKALAGMGHSLDQKSDTIDHEVEKIKRKYQRGGN